MMNIVIAVVVLIVVWQLIGWLVYGIGDTDDIDTRDPEGGTFGKMFNWHKREVRNTTVGWRPDPNGNDGFTPDPGNSQRKANGTYKTPSGNREYYKVVRDK